MHLPILLKLLAFSLPSLISAATPERTTDIFAWPLSAPAAQTLAQVSYTTTNASLTSFTAPTIPPSDTIVRVGFYHASGQWSGIATSASNFAAEMPKKLLLHVRPDGELYHVGFQTVGGAGRGKRDGLEVEVRRMQPGPTEQLNKPVVVSADGTVDQKEPEKTFLQKYWWAIALFLVFQLVVGGGAGKE